MKKLLIALSLGVFLAGCSTTSEYRVISSKPLSRISILVGDTTRSADGEEFSIGGGKTLKAQGFDENNKPVSAGNPAWVALIEGIVAIFPSTGESVTVTGIKVGSTEIQVLSGNIKETITVYVRE